MAFGPGKYDAELNIAKAMAGATNAVLLIIDGRHGGGFSAQLTPALTAGIPTMLRSIADSIEADLRSVTRDG